MHWAFNLSRVPVSKRLDGQLQARFMDRATAQRHLANVERHIAEGRASVLRQHEIIGRLQNAESRRSETASIARAFLHQMERRLEMHIADRDWLQDQLR